MAANIILIQLSMKLVLYLCFSFFSIISFAQHDMGKMKMEGDTMKMEYDSMQMSHAYSLNLPMNRNGSGTGWMPDATPMYGYMLHYKKWMYMFHGSLFIRYNNQDITNEGNRGGEKFDAPNWIMAMGQRKIGKRGLFHFSSMFSLDPLTVGGEGYPLLFQTGETYNGKPLVDSQHPHDLFDELSVAYTHMISKDFDITGYLAYPGEPALGPTAFMHRISSFNNPDAPLSHHWQDATHITYGVATLGLRYKKFKLEGSSFTGREPDEDRYNFDTPRFDSYSFRLSFNPTENFSLQASHAFTKSPETLEPEKNITKHSVSILHSVILGEKKHLSSALIWGANQTGNKLSHSALLESNLQMNKTAVYGRYELVQKEGKDLQIPQTNGNDEIFLVKMLTIGASYNFLTVANTNLRAGLQGSIYTSDEKLNSYYGKNPMALELYLHIVPSNR